MKAKTNKDKDSYVHGNVTTTIIQYPTENRKDESVNVMFKRQFEARKD